MRYADDITTDTVTLVVSTTSQPAGALSGLIKLITPPKLGMYMSILSVKVCYIYVYIRENHLDQKCKLNFKNTELYKRISCCCLSYVI